MTFYFFFQSLRYQSQPLCQLATHLAPISGYKVNYTKSEAMPLGLGLGLAQALFRSNGPLRVLFILVLKCHLILRLNFEPTIRIVKNDLERWHDLPLSCMGRISLLKMNILPRFFYPLPMLLLWISKKVILDLERAFSRFIWHNKRPRISI